MYLYNVHVYTNTLCMYMSIVHEDCLGSWGSAREGLVTVCDFIIIIHVLDLWLIMLLNWIGSKFNEHTSSCLIGAQE